MNRSRSAKGEPECGRLRRDRRDLHTKSKQPAGKVRIAVMVSWKLSRNGQRSLHSQVVPLLDAQIAQTNFSTDLTKRKAALAATDNPFSGNRGAGGLPGNGSPTSRANVGDAAGCLRFAACPPLFASCGILLFVQMVHRNRHRPDGRRHSLDVLADSTYDAAICSSLKRIKSAQSDCPSYASNRLEVVPTARCITSPECTAALDYRAA